MIYVNLVAISSQRALVPSFQLQLNECLPELTALYQVGRIYLSRRDNHMTYSSQLPVALELTADLEKLLSGPGNCSFFLAENFTIL